jgi:Nif-specific regulatory protein
MHCRRTTGRGNIRELENEVQRLVIQAEPGHWIEITDLSPQLRKIEGTITRIAPQKGTLKEMMDQVERWLLTEALRDHGGNKTKTAVTLGITREGCTRSSRSSASDPTGTISPST